MARALVTGGTSGIGAAFARALAERGDDLVLVARNTERLAQSAAELTTRYGVSVETLAADLSDRSDTRRVADRLTSQEQPIDLLVNNAGFGVRAALTAEDTGPHDYAIDVMIRAVLVLGGAAGRAMRGRGHGVIVNVSSTAGYITMGSYSAIKSWVTTYSEGLANELRGSGVTVTALCPGWVRTEFHERAAIRTSSIPDPMWLDADSVVREGLAAADRGQVVCIPSKRYKAMMFAANHAVPRSVVRAVSRAFSSRRH